MKPTLTDIIVFVAFFAAVLSLSLWKSRKEKNSEDYFLAGRNLPWWIIGISIVAANISTEQFVGMAGQGAGSVGLAVSNWQLAGAVGVVVIAFTLLPAFLKAGIYTMPEFLEYRYNALARSLMAILTVIIYVTVLMTAVLYSGGLTLETIFGMDLRVAVWIIGLIAGVYTVAGGLKAVAWADLIQGTALILGGIIVFFLGLRACGGWGEFSSSNADKLHMILPSDHPDLPWSGVVSGMAIVILYYCGLNQFIVQRNLAAKSLRDGQLGVIFAGALWLLVPFVIVMPGIMANNLYQGDLREAADRDNAPKLEKFEELQSGATGELVVFTPDQEWQERYPARATEIEAYNQQIRGTAESQGVDPKEELLLGRKADAAFPTLIKKLIPAGLRGLMFAAIAGAVISSLASMMNSASTIFTMDVYKRLLDRSAPERRLVFIGRAVTLVCVVGGCVLAPRLNDPAFGGVFNFIQNFQGYIWPGVVAAFLMGLLMPHAPASAGVAALVAGPAIYGMFQKWAGNLHFLIQVSVTFVLVVFLMSLLTFLAPLREPRKLPIREEMNVTTAPEVKWAGAAVLLLVAVFYVMFW